jgi:hypothetical protein
LSGRKRFRRHDRQVDELDAVALELELLLEPLRQGEEQARADIVAAAGQDLARSGHPADVGVLLQAQDAQSAAREQRGGREAVVPGADHHHVVVGNRAHAVSFAARICSRRYTAARAAVNRFAARRWSSPTPRARRPPDRVV